MRVKTLDGGEIEESDLEKEIFKIPDDYKGDPLTDEEIALFKDKCARPFDKCVSCEEYLIDLQRKHDYALDDGEYCEKADGFVCCSCLESDGDYSNTVIVFDPKNRDATKYTVGQYRDLIWGCGKDINPDNLDDINFSPLENGESPIQFAYVKTDGWRGYHEPVKPVGWIEYHHDQALSWSEDAEELKKFDVDVKKMLWENGIEFALCYTQTSNVFCMNYDILVKVDEDELKMFALIMRLQRLRLQYRDADRFARTALTGSDEDTKESRLLVKAARMLEKGVDFDEVKEQIIEEMKK